MIIQFNLGSQTYASDLSAGNSLAIDVNFGGPQPNHFAADPASLRPYEIGNFVGRTNMGGGCNVDIVSLVTHCNGTHTESVQHIVNDAVPIAGVAPRGLMLALVISMEPVSAEGVDESYRPKLEKTDRVITAVAVRDVVDSIGMNVGGNRDQVIEGLSVEGTVVEGTVFDEIDALIVRTLPNSHDKKSAVYSEENQPPFFTCEAMTLIDSLKIDHLLVDFPSLDRMYDDGLLTNHHLFWNVPEGMHMLAGSSLTQRTITEFVFVPDEKTDGVYLLEIGCPAWKTDAAPSRPLIFDITK